MLMPDCPLTLISTAKIMTMTGKTTTDKIIPATSSKAPITSKVATAVSVVGVGILAIVEEIKDKVKVKEGPGAEVVVTEVTSTLVAIRAGHAGSEMKGTVDPRGKRSMQ